MAYKYLPSSNLPGAGPGRFQTTAWTVVLQAKDPNDSQFKTSLDYLVTTYWKPVYLFVRSKGKTHEQSKDLTQEFFALFLEKNFLKKVDREKGRFRTFLLTALTRFLYNEHARSKALKRGGGLKPLQSLDAMKDEELGTGFEPAKGETPEEAFNRHWAQALLERVFENLEKVCKAEGKDLYYQVLREQYFGAAIEGRRPSYKDIAERLKLSEIDVTNYLHRAKNIFRDILRQEIRSYVSQEEEVDEEIRDLWRGLSA
ncbi:MAG: sigma-70 family RNA polymerase sigma factor [Planctomycetota bacterium]|nr:sigma-70 family RNA polymerase sigma factor [Planctomycetota bacterium]